MKLAAWSAMAGLLFLATDPRAAEPVARIETSSNASTAHPADTSDLTPLGAQGMRAYIDPATGELIEEPVTPEQRDQAENPAVPTPDYSKLTVETLPDGSVRVQANGQLRSTSTIQLEADGSTRVGCTQSGPHADHQHAPPTAGAQP